jgi:RHS repeat-associated protein
VGRGNAFLLGRCFRPREYLQYPAWSSFHSGRRGPYEQDINDPENPKDPFDDPYPSYFVGDRFLASYTYGPLGPIFRTAEYDDADLTNNRDYYYLRDASGGHRQKFEVRSAKIETCEPGFPALVPSSKFHSLFDIRHSSFTRDAFGNHPASPLYKGGSQGGRLSGAGSFAWRGGEGSVSDREPNLVHMQARHYDPTLGRFIQADTMMLASMTTQGMNRYIYTENDPVNMTDATGEFPWLIVMGIAWILLRGLERMIAKGRFRCVLAQLRDWLGDTLVDALLGLVTGLGRLGWLGVGLVALGMIVTYGSAGLLFALGGTIIFAGMLLIMADLAVGEFWDWVLGDPLSDAFPTAPEGSAYALAPRYWLLV